MASSHKQEQAQQPQPGSNMHFHHFSSHHGFGHHHHNQHHTAIKTPKGQNSPTLASMSLAEPSSGPCSTLIIDTDGEMHDPSYMSALRALQNEITAQAHRPLEMRRPSSSHTPSRPSQLGLHAGGRRISDDAAFSSDGSSDGGDVYSNPSRSQDMSRAYRSSSLASSTRPPLSNGMSSSGSQSQVAITPPQTPSLATATTSAIKGAGSETPPKERSRRASWTHRKKGSSRPTTPRSAALALAQEAERKKEYEWGFTGIVDIEREQRAAQLALDEEMQKQQQQQEQQQKGEVGESHHHGLSRWASKSMRRKGSNSSANEAESPPKSLGLSFQSGNSPSFWSMTQNKLSHRRQSSSSLQEDRPRLYSTKDADHAGLSTILSGNEMAGGEETSSDKWSTNSDPTLKQTFQQIEDDIQRQREDADFVLGPSKYKQTKDSVIKKGEEVMDVQTHAHDLRRKMEMMAYNVRFSAFRAKRKLERGMKA